MAEIRVRVRLLVGALLLVAGGLGVLVPVAQPADAASTPLAVHVSGNTLVDGAGQVLQLRGVNRSGTEYACIQGWGIFDGPSGAASVAAIASWNTNVVRVPLNEDCWLGINGVSPTYGGAAYRRAIHRYITKLHAAGLLAILDLHTAAPGATPSTDIAVMVDADHGPAFWTSVATAYKSDPAVIFDLYNEPHDISWPCWRDGCTTPEGWKTVGMQSLVDAVRATGATQPVLVGGVGYAGDLTRWPKYRPTDPAHQLVASFHQYNFGACTTQACWSSELGPVLRSVPVVTGELGENDCDRGFVDPFMAWADRRGVSYLGWTWTTGGGWTCEAGPTLVTDYLGTPTGLGVAFRDHFAARAGDS